jgi:hypothetical protein
MIPTPHQNPKTPITKSMNSICKKSSQKDPKFQKLANYVRNRIFRESDQKLQLKFITTRKKKKEKKKNLKNLFAIGRHQSIHPSMYTFQTLPPRQGKAQHNTPARIKETQIQKSRQTHGSVVCRRDIMRATCPARGSCFRV